MVKIKSLNLFPKVKLKRFKNLIKTKKPQKERNKPPKQDPCQRKLESNRKNDLKNILLIFILNSYFCTFYFIIKSILID